MEGELAGWGRLCFETRRIDGNAGWGSCPLPSATFEQQENIAMSIEIKITLHDEKQAHALKNALDLYCRLCMGQFGEIADLMRSEVIPAMTDHTGPRVPLAIESIERVDALLDHMKYAIGYNGMNMSIGNPNIHDTAHRNWELLKVLRRELAIHRNPAPIARGTDYDGLTLRYTQDEAPEVQITVSPA
jgi:hypothetical protein